MTCKETRVEDDILHDDVTGTSTKHNNQTLHYLSFERSQNQCGIQSHSTTYDKHDTLYPDKKGVNVFVYSSEALKP